jgi:putative heme iron utilization protein
MPYAVDGDGRPVFFISSMAMHTQNLEQDPRASLLITQPDTSGDPLGAARVSVIGAADRAATEEVRELYLSRNKSAKLWQDYSDFSYYRLEVAAVYFIGGFGVMGWVSVEDYRNAKPDPLAETAQEIIRHMNADHGEALRQLARHYSGEIAEEVSMTAVDRLGFHLKLTSGESVLGRRVPFIREVASSDDARNVIIEMVHNAKAG